MKKRKQLIIILVILTVGITVFFVTKKGKDNKAIEREAARETYVVTNNDIALNISLAGMLLPKNSETVYSMTQGKIVAIYKTEGQMVKKNEVVIKLDTKFQDNQLAIAEYRYKLAKLSSELASKALKTAVNMPKETPGYTENKEKAQIQLDSAVEQEKQARLGLEAQQMLTENYYIKAPFDGKITSLDLKIGNIVAPQIPLFKISDNSRWIVQAYIDESEVLSIKNNMVANINMDAVNKTFSGKVFYISNTLGVTPEGLKGYKIKVILDKTDVALIEGISADVDILIEEVKDVLSVPSEALLLDNDREYVFLKTAEGEVKKEVITGVEGTDYIEITEGLNLGDIIYRRPTASDGIGDAIIQQIESVKN